MEEPAYQIQILYYQDPYKIWVHRLDEDSWEGQFEQIGLYGVLPLACTVDNDANVLKADRSDRWTVASVKLLGEFFGGADEVWFEPKFADRRLCIFDSGLHKFGKIFIKQVDGSVKKLSSCLAKASLALKCKMDFYESFTAGNIKVKLEEGDMFQIMQQLLTKLKDDKTMLEKLVKEMSNKIVVRDNMEALEKYLRKMVYPGDDEFLNDNNINLTMSDVSTILKNKLHDYNTYVNTDDVEFVGRAVNKPHVNNTSSRLTRALKAVKKREVQLQNGASTCQQHGGNVDASTVVNESLRKDVIVLGEKSKRNGDADLRKDVTVLSEKSKLCQQNGGDLRKKGFECVPKGVEETVNKVGTTYDMLKAKASKKKESNLDGGENIKILKLAKQRIEYDQNKESLYVLQPAGLVDLHSLKVKKKSIIRSVDAKKDFYKPADDIKTDLTNPWDAVEDEINAELTRNIKQERVLEKIINNSDASELRVEERQTVNNVVDTYGKDKDDQEGKEKEAHTAKKGDDKSKCDNMNRLLRRRTKVALQSKGKQPPGFFNAKDVKSDELDSNAKDVKSNDLNSNAKDVKSNDLNSNAKDVKSHDLNSNAKYAKSDDFISNSDKSTIDTNPLNVSSSDSVSEADDNLGSSVSEHLRKRLKGRIPLVKADIKSPIGLGKVDNTILKGNTPRLAFDETSKFIEKIIARRLMIHSTRIIKTVQSCTEVCDANFTPSVHRGLFEMSVLKPMRLQTVSWPCITRGYNLFLVAPMNSGKTMGYLPAVCSLVYDKEIYSDLPDTHGPLCIILAASSSSVSEIAGVCKRFLRHHCTVLGAHVGCKESDIQNKLLNGTDVLVTTPPFLYRLLGLGSSVLDLKRLSVMVVDDADVVNRKYLMEFMAIYRSVGKMLKKRVNTEMLVQYVVAGREWSDLLRDLSQGKTSVVCISAYEECMAYSLSPVRLEFSLKDDKPDAVARVMKKVARKTVIMCCNDDDVGELEERLSKEVSVVFSCAGRTSIEDIYKTAQALSEFDLPYAELVLVCCDEHLKYFGVTDAWCLVHYSLPVKYSVFCERFSVLLENYRNIYQHGTDAGKLPKILHYVERCSSVEIPKPLVELSQQVLAERDLAKVKMEVPICNSLLLFGSCQDYWHCALRHTVDNFYDKPPGWLPRSGWVNFRIIHFHSTAHYSVQVLSYDANGIHVDIERRDSDLALKMSLYFGDEENKRSHGEPKNGDVCGVELKQSYFERCKVVKVRSYRATGDPDEVLVSLIDEEKLEVVRACNLLYLPEDLKSVPCQVAQVRILNIIPKDKDECFTEESRESLRSIVQKYDNLYLKAKISLVIGNVLFVDSIKCCQDLKSSKTSVVRFNIREDLLSNDLVIEDKSHYDSLLKFCKKCNYAAVDLLADMVSTEKTNDVSVDDFVSTEKKKDVSVHDIVSTEKKRDVSVDDIVSIEKKKDVSVDDIVSIETKKDVSVDDFVSTEKKKDVSVHDIVSTEKKRDVSVDDIVSIEKKKDVSVDDIVSVEKKKDVLVDDIVSMEQKKDVSVDDIVSIEKKKDVSVDDIVSIEKTKDVSVDDIVSIEKKKDVSVDDIVSIEKKKDVLVKPQWAHLTAESYNHVYISYVENLQQFYVRQLKWQDELDSLTKLIQNYVKDLDAESKREFVYGDLVVAKFPDDGLFYRARVEDLNGTNARCFFVDHGDWRSVGLAGLFPITNDILAKLPFQAIECRLLGLNPVGEAWSDMSTNYMCDLCYMGEDLDMKELYVWYYLKDGAFSTDGFRYAVVVVDTMSDEDIVFNELFPNMNLAQIIPEEFGLFEDLAIRREKSANEVKDVNFDAASLGSSEISVTFDFSNLKRFVDGIEGSNEGLKEICGSTTPKIVELDETCSSDNVKANTCASSSSFETVSDLSGQNLPCQSAKVETGEASPSRPVNGECLPKLLWCQDKHEITIKIELFGVESYNIEITKTSLAFNTLVSSRLYKFDIALFGGVRVGECRHEAKGLYVSVRLKKLLPSMWPFLVKGKGKQGWISYDHSVFDCSDSDSDSVEDMKRANEEFLRSAAARYDSECESEDGFVRVKDDAGHWEDRYNSD